MYYLKFILSLCLKVNLTSSLLLSLPRGNKSHIDTIYIHRTVQIHAQGYMKMHCIIYIHVEFLGLLYILNEKLGVLLCYKLFIF